MVWLGLAVGLLAPARADTGHPPSTPTTRLLLPVSAQSASAVKRSPLVLPVDATVVPSSVPVAARLVGEVPGEALIVTDAHASRPGGMGLCQSGTERFLRVLRTDQGGGGGGAKETYRVKLESCRDDIELATPGLDWQPATGTLRIEWLQGPGVKGVAETRLLRIGAGGAVKVQSVP